MKSNEKQELENEMKSIFESNSPIIIEWAELVRESLNAFDDSQQSAAEEPPNHNPAEPVPTVPRLTIHSRDPIIDRKSTFQAFYVDIEHASQAIQFRDQLLENNKLKNATHNMFAPSSKYLLFYQLEFTLL